MSSPVLLCLLCIMWRLGFAHFCNHKCYDHDEASRSNTIGINKCATDCDCSSVRTCIDGKCNGESTYFEKPSCEMYKPCNTKCYDVEEAFNMNGEHKCRIDCECASMRQCINGICHGTSTFFDEPSCSERIQKCVQLLEEYKLYHIWPTLQRHGFNDTSLWVHITDKILENMKLAESDIKRFKNLQKALQCNTKCYSHEESENIHGRNQCENDCECASTRRCIDNVCTGWSTFFDEPSCDKRTQQCMEWLEKYQLAHIWPILDKFGFNSTSMWPHISDNMLQKMNIKDSDIIRFKNLQKGLASLQHDDDMHNGESKIESINVDANFQNGLDSFKHNEDMHNGESINVDAKCIECVQWLKRYELQHIWQTLKRFGWSSTSLWLDITQELLEKMNIRDSDIVRFKKLQKAIEKENQTFIAWFMEIIAPIITFYNANTTLITAVFGFVFPTLVLLYNRFKG